MQIAEIRGSTISVRRACQFVLLGIFTLIAQSGALAQVSFYTAVDLALRNSTPVRIGAAAGAARRGRGHGKRGRL